MFRAVIRSSSLAGVASAIVAVFSGIVWSIVYWRYPFSEPTWRSWIQELGSVHSFQQVNISRNREPELGASGAAALREASERYKRWGSDFEASKLGFEVERAGWQPKLSQAIPIELFKAVCDQLDRAGVLVSGDPGYPNARVLHGFLMIGQLRDGDAVLLASISGLEASNDHYPQYQAKFTLVDGKPRLRSARQYYIDIAGIEGARWWHVSLALGLIMVPSSIGLAAIVAVIVYRRRSRYRSEALLNAPPNSR